MSCIILRNAHSSAWLYRGPQTTWIGLQNTVNSCGCDGDASSAACQQCRSVWTWTDGADATAYANWNGVGPWSGENIGSLGPDGTWGTLAYNANNPAMRKFICKKGNKNKTHIISTFYFCWFYVIFCKLFCVIMWKTTTPPNMTRMVVWVRACVRACDGNIVLSMLILGITYASVQDNLYTAYWGNQCTAWSGSLYTQPAQAKYTSFLR